MQQLSRFHAFRPSRRSGSLLAIGAALFLGAAAPAPKAPPFVHWIDGTTAGEPETQVQRIDADTFVIRQSVLTNFEAPFLYLLFGKDRALLIDTGAGGLKVRPTIDRLIAEWQASHGGRPIRLVVAHSHSHGDHHAGDGEFRDRPDTDLVGLAPAEVAAFFHVAHWPDDIAKFDLGGRVLDIIPTPGHEPAHIMVYDARTQLLFSGDMLYPGRLYVPLNRFADFRASADPRFARRAYRNDHHARSGLSDEGGHPPLRTSAGAFARSDRRIPASGGQGRADAGDGSPRRLHRLPGPRASGGLTTSNRR
jgi:glyoxylase-like metal-dependent hydrolase (beta-lactamase superfamily II)